MSVILADLPELLALATLASVPASKMAAAFNDPDHFFDHLSLEELARLTSAVERLQALSASMVAAVDQFRQIAETILSEVPNAD